MFEWIQPGLLVLIIGGLVRVAHLLGKISAGMVNINRVQILHEDDIENLQVQTNELDGDVRVLEARLKAAGINGDYARIR